METAKHTSFTISENEDWLINAKELINRLGYDCVEKGTRLLGLNEEGKAKVGIEIKGGELFFNYFDDKDLNHFNSLFDAYLVADYEDVNPAVKTILEYTDKTIKELKKFLYFDVEDAKNFQKEIVNVYQKHMKAPENHQKRERQKEQKEEFRKAIFKKDDDTCQICGTKKSDLNKIELVIDHIIPVSRGGYTEENNCQTLCSNCNKIKSAKMEVW